MDTAGALLFSPVPAEKVVACVGLISDTHMPERCAALPASTFEVLHGVDLILHAGDVGERTFVPHIDWEAGRRSAGFLRGARVRRVHGTGL